MRAFAGLSGAFCEGDIAYDRMVRAFVAPVLMGLDSKASGHSPTPQSDGVTVTVTGHSVNIGAIASPESVV